MTEDWDYIIAGGGSAGSVLAARLSEDPDVKVLLLEAGGRNRDIRVASPVGFGLTVGNPRFDWNYRTVPQAHLKGREIHWPRGKGMGGSSAINGLIYIRGNRRDFDRWHELGLDGWAYNDVLPYFRKSESRSGGENQWRGATGPMLVGPVGQARPLDSAFIEACRAAGLPPNSDFNAESQVGVGHYDVTVRDGKRSSVSRCYLDRRSRRSNLTIVTGAHVSRILFQGDRARGVAYRVGSGERTARANLEILLCMGAIGSPQLLMLSGVGPADHLGEHGIDVVLDQPAVGANLQDHPNIPVQFGCRDARLTFDRWQKPHLSAWLGLTYLLSGGTAGPGSRPFWSAGAFPPGVPDPAWPHLQMFFTPMMFRDDPERGRKYAIPGFQIDVNLMRPESRGNLRLRSPDPRDDPLLDPNYLSEENDRRQMIDGIELAREIAGRSPLHGYSTGEVSPGAGRRSRAEILDGLRENLISGYHPVGTCRMGADGDRMAVLDARLRVRGLQGLRVVDGSAMPCLTTGNTNAPIVMMAEKAADMCREDCSGSKSRR